MPLIKNIVLSSKNIIILSYEKGFFHLLSANGLSRFFDFGSHLILAWIFVPEDLGRIKTMQSFLAILFVFASLGLDVSTLKICSEKRSVEEKRSYFNFALILTLASAVFTFIVFAIISWLGVFSVDRIINQYLWVIAFSIIPNTIVQVYLSFFQAQRKLKEYSYIQVAARIVAIIVVMVLSFLFY
jgi:O-antigen/teichoic acid export membrane protein